MRAKDVPLTFVSSPPTPFRGDETNRSRGIIVAEYALSALRKKSYLATTSNLCNYHDMFRLFV